MHFYGIRIQFLKSSPDHYSFGSFMRGKIRSHSIIQLSIHFIQKLQVGLVALAWKQQGKTA